jgi:type IV pilus assembly protein PilW
VKHIQPGSHRQGGFSLVELMVAVTIGLFLLAGAVTMFATNRRIYNDQQDLGDLQQSARFALELIAYDLRQAGYIGCAHDLGRLTNNLTGAPANGGVAGSQFDFTRAVEGLEAGANWLPSNNAVDFVVTNRGGTPVALADANGPAVDANSDAITIRSVGGPREDITAPAPATAGGSVVIDNRTMRIVQGEVLAISDCAGTDLFQNTADVAAIEGAQLLHDAGGGGTEAGNATPTLSREYTNIGGTPASVSRVTAVRYFIGTFLPQDTLFGDEPARRGLFRRYWDPLAPGGPAMRNELMVDGVDRMEITYGVDQTGDGLPDLYAPASDGALGAVTNNWDNVVAVRIGLLLRSLRPQAGVTDTPPAAADPICAEQRNVNGSCVPYGSQAGAAALGLVDGVRRRVVNTTVFLRNNPL